MIKGKGMKELTDSKLVMGERNQLEEPVGKQMRVFPIGMLTQRSHR